MPLNGNGWNPTIITRAIEGFTTATHTSRIETNSGEGFLKALGNPEGPHALACELVGSLVADWLGLRTFDFSVIEVQQPNDVFIEGRSWAQPGPAFISKAENKGFTWGGDAQTISATSNKEDISRLVVLDTWLRNCDRYSPDGRRKNLKNVFMVQRTEPKRHLELIAMDFTHAFTCGRPLTRALGHIEVIKDPSIFGLFPEFRPLLVREEVRKSSLRLSEFNDVFAEAIVSKIPTAWEVDKPTRGVIRKYLVERAHFNAETIEDRLWPETNLLPYMEE